jgi:hypothetical protein
MALRSLRLRRDEWLDDLPQFIGHQFLAQLSFPHIWATPCRSPLIHVRQALTISLVSEGAVTVP